MRREPHHRHALPSRRSRTCTVIAVGKPMIEPPRHRRRFARSRRASFGQALRWRPARRPSFVDPVDKLAPRWLRSVSSRLFGHCSASPCSAVAGSKHYITPFPRTTACRIAKHAYGRSYGRGYETIERACKRMQGEGKSPSVRRPESSFAKSSTHIREAKARSTWSAKQAIAIGLSKARRAGVPLKPPKPGAASEQVRAKAAKDYAKGSRARRSAE